MDIKARSCLLGLLSLSACGLARAHTVPLPPTNVEAAISDPRRPDDQVKLDVNRKPALSVLFSEAKAGDRIADVMSGNGYFTRILSDVVGPSGRVYAYLPTEQIAHCSPSEIAGTHAVARDSSYRNVTLLIGSLADFRLPEKLDLIWMSQSYHDLHDPFLGPAKVAVINKVIFDALKPGGIFLVIDHVAERSKQQGSCSNRKVMRFVIPTTITNGPFSIRTFTAGRIKCCSDSASPNRTPTTSAANPRLGLQLIRGHWVERRLCGGRVRMARVPDWPTTVESTLAIPSRLPEMSANGTANTSHSPYDDAIVWVPEFVGCHLTKTCIIFDIDGTLIDSTDVDNQLYATAVRRVLGNDVANARRPIACALLVGLGNPAGIDVHH